MKIVMAVIKPFKLEEVRDALTAIGVHGLDGDGGQRLRPAERPYGNDRGANTPSASCPN